MCIEEFLTNFPFILLLNLEISRVKMMMEGMCGSCYCCSGLGLVEIGCEVLNNGTCLFLICGTLLK